MRKLARLALACARGDGRGFALCRAWTAHGVGRRSGFSLLEMLVVLAILVSLAALSLPAMRMPLAKTELLEAAKQVRAKLVQTRLRAIESGVVQQFRYRPGSGYFQTGPSSTADIGESPFFSSGDSPGQRPLQDLAAPDQAKEEEEGEELQRGVCFLQEPSHLDEASELIENEPEESRDTGQAAAWSAPILFYPNGKSSNARLRLSGAQHLFVEVTLCGITGVVKIGEMVREEAEP